MPPTVTALLDRLGGSSPHRRGVVSGLISALVVMAVAVGASSFQRHLIENSAQEALELRASTIEAAAATEVARYLGVLTVVADGMESFDTITAERFRGITDGVERLGLDGASSIVFIGPPVPAGGVEAAQARWRPDFGDGLELQPVEGQDEHVFALVSSSLDGRPDRPGGTDVTAADAPYAALLESARTGAPAVSDAYVLLIDQQLPAEERQTSFSLVVPVERDGGLLGWVLMGLRGQDFLGHVLDVAGEGTVGTSLEADDAAGVPTRVASVGLDGTESSFAASRTLAVAQQDWTLSMSADLDVLVGPSRVMPRNALLAGMLLSVLVGVLVWLAVSGRQRSELRVLRATAELAAAELVSRRQASLLDVMLETIDDVGVSVVDADGRFLIQSRAAREILGIDGTAADGPDATPSDPGRWQDNFGVFTLDGVPMDSEDMPLVRAMRGESTDAFSMLIRNPGRPEGAQLEVSGRPLSLGDGRQAALAVFRDVTEERLQQSELAGFAGVVAHDLRHPLTVISGYVGLLVDDCLPELQGEPELLATTESYLAKVTAGTARMAELISDLLDYTTARDADMTWRSVDLQALTDEVAASHRDVGGAGNRPVPHIHVGRLPAIEGDPDRLQQLLANLIGNAVKYVAPGAVPSLDVSAEVHDGRVRLRFADRGLGIPTSRLADVFRPFVRAHTDTPEGLAYTGTGLGLAICHQVVQRHGGEIAARANPGGGTVVVVDLPLAGPDAEGSATPRPSTAWADQPAAHQPAGLSG
jgi:signal transduction histidine kinase